ncbi:MAG: hypothetical protein JWN83_2781 [Chitinophagaceae bacterium]|nr:hypothetical protein [Chitinophagaceae bacterium]
MKKNLIILSAAFILLITFFSCKKLASAIFGGFETSVDFQVSIPAVPIVSPVELPLGQFYYKFNLDSIVKAKTGGVYGANDVKSIKVKQFNVTITNADPLNNVSNFQSVRVTMQSNTNNTPLELFSITFPDTYAPSFTAPGNNAELLSYLKGSDIIYNMYGKNRRITTKSLTIILSVTINAS